MREIVRAGLGQRRRRGRADISGGGNSGRNIRAVGPTGRGSGATGDRVGCRGRLSPVGKVLNMLCYAMLCCDMLCYAMLCCDMLCYATLWYVML